MCSMYLWCMLSWWCIRVAGIFSVEYAVPDPVVRQYASQSTERPAALPPTSLWNWLKPPTVHAEGEREAQLQGKPQKPLSCTESERRAFFNTCLVSVPSSWLLCQETGFFFFFWAVDAYTVLTFFLHRYIDVCVCVCVCGCVCVCVCVCVCGCEWVCVFGLTLLLLPD